ncbi:ABC transporter substrate-binding protein [Acuticoccus kandeliae]|uniref:ABC transporter substrate-binding protein n=1 Tax=Acuticoccus kandeliae TaxID=2073160 RepID=UPI001300AC70|nr:ABC transporter substrate-binding protein [Acuticoccus kandeliae]
MTDVLASSRLAGVGLAAVLLASSGALAQSTDALKGSGSVVVSTWGGSYTDAQVAAFFAPFTEATGIEVVTTGTPDAAKLKLMHESGNVEWDVVDAEAQMMEIAKADGALAPIDYDLVYSVTPEADLITDNLKEFGFPSISFGWVLAWNTDAEFPNGAPQSWADFWDTEKFPGRRALYAQPKPLLEAALLADGVPAGEIYPIDLDRAFAKLDEIADDIDVWYENLGQADVLLQNGEVDMMLTSNGRAHAAKKDGFAVDFTFNDGAWEQGYWVVPAGAPNAENAMKLIAWTSQPEGEAAFAEAFGYGGPNKKSYEGLSEEVLAGLPTAPQNLENQVAVSGEWWAENLDAVNERWLEWYSNR